MSGLRHSRWYWRFVAFASLHIALILTATFAIMPFVMRYTDTHYPGVFYYHLEPNEDPGPLGNLGAVVFFMTFELGLWIAAMLPTAIYLRMRWWAVFLAALSYIPLQFALMLGVR